MAAPARILLVHWNSDEAAERAARLRAWGHRVQTAPPLPAFRELRENPPAAFVIDLSRLPSHGREVAGALRESKATRQIPLVFAGGEPTKLERFRTQFPGALFADWESLRATLQRAIEHPLPVAAGPSTGPASKPQTPLVQKLGIGQNSVVRLVNAPPDFQKVLGTLPQGATLRRAGNSKPNLVLLFARSVPELKAGLRRWANSAANGGLWVCWPKHSSSKQGALTQAEVRRLAHAAGLVDSKVCSVDATWSALRLTQRKRR